MFLINFYIRDNFELANLKNYIKLIKGEYRVSQEEWTKLRESVPYVEL